MTKGIKRALDKAVDRVEAEIEENPAWRQLAQALSREWPYWLHFLSHELSPLGLLLASLCPVQTVREAGRVGMVFTDRMAVYQLLTQWFDAMNRLHEMYRVDTGWNDSVTAHVSFLEGAT